MNVLDCLELTGPGRRQPSGGKYCKESLVESIDYNLRMITGDEVLTSGQSFIGTISLSNNRAQYLQSIGYCPQFDSIIEVNKYL